MSSTKTMERTGTGVAGMAPGMMTPPVSAPAAMPHGMNWLTVPRCTMKVEKCPGGMKLTCSCDDKTACSMVQNLCTMLQGGMCSCCCMMNGMTVCCYNFTMGMCRCETTDKGVCVTCTSGDPECGKMIQACCDCLSSMLKAGCTCCVMFNNTPVCCGCC
jgi:hypothetical protein